MRMKSLFMWWWPLLHLHVQLPFLEVRTALMCKVLEREQIDYVVFNVRVWCWRFEFSLYNLLNRVRRKQKTPYLPIKPEPEHVNCRCGPTIKTPATDQFTDLNIAISVLNDHNMLEEAETLEHRATKDNVDHFLGLDKEAKDGD